MKSQGKFIGFWFFRENIGSTYTAAWTQYYKWGYIILILFTIAGTILTRRQWRSYLILYLLFAHDTIFYMLYHVQTRYGGKLKRCFLSWRPRPYGGFSNGSWHLWNKRTSSYAKDRPKLLISTDYGRE
jgi:hypothetical protein